MYPYSIYQMKDEEALRYLLDKLGFHSSPDREETPKRFLKVVKEFLHNENNKIDFKITTFPNDYKGIIKVSDIDTYSMCEHHLLPFRNKIEVQYIPNGVVVGLSKIPRIVKYFSKRYTSAEKLVQDIGRFLFEHKDLNPGFVKVTCKSYHTCCASRGIEKEVEMITEAVYER